MQLFLYAYVGLSIFGISFFVCLGVQFYNSVYALLGLLNKYVLT